MPITNINTLQNLSKSEDLKTYTDLYLNESLANLGQRFSVKGDGLQLGEFSIYDLLDINYDSEIHNYSYAQIDINKEHTLEGETLNITLSYIDNNAELNPQKTISLEGDFPIKTDEDIKFDSRINQIDYYGKGGIIRKLDNDYITGFAGYVNTPENTIREVVFSDFVINNNSVQDRLGYSLRFYESNGFTRALYCKLVSARNNEYAFTLYDLLNYDLASFKEFIFDEIGTGESLDVADLVSKLEENSEIQVAITNDGRLCKDIVAICTDEGNGNITFKFDKNSFDNYATEVSNKAICIAYDVTVFYNNITEYYNKKIYFVGDDNITLKKKLVMSVAKQIFVDYNKEYTNFVNSKSEEVSANTDYSVDSLSIYLPLNYKFIYNCNSNDQSKIYSSESSISVEFTIKENIKSEMFKILQGDKSEQVWICLTPDSTSIDDKYNVYRYDITYTRDNIVDDINVTKEFTLPYIDNNGYWCINNMPTSIYARGKDGGQPNIIMTYTDTTIDKDKGGCKVISTFKRDEISNLDWAPTKVRVRPLDDNNNLEQSTYHILNTYMPININSLNENMITLLEHAVILNINSVHSEDRSLSTTAYTLSDELGKDCVVPTFWSLTKVRNEDAFGTDDDQFKYEFTYVQQPNAYWAVDMNYLSNAEGIVKHYMNFGIEPDEYEHRWLVFKKISTEFKNSTDFSPKQIWPAFKNFQKIDYAGVIGAGKGVASSYYQNELNMVLGFFDSVNKTPGTNAIYEVDQNPDSPKYFTVDNNSQVKNVINYSNYPTEFIPDAVRANEEIAGVLVPTLDLAEVFVRNQSTINRNNILSFSKNRYVYNAYIGSAFDQEDKSILHIGSSSYNINIGNKTLMSYEDTHNFGRMREIDVDFDKILLNGNVTIKGASFDQTTDESGKLTSWSMVKPVSYIGNIFEFSESDDWSKTAIENVLFCYIAKEISPGRKICNDIVEPVTKNVSYLNLTKYLNEVAKIEGFNKNECKFVGDEDHIWKTGNTYMLQLATDLTDIKYHHITNEGGFEYDYVTTNPISFAYTNDISGMEFNVREILSDTSRPYFYTVASLN